MSKNVVASDGTKIPEYGSVCLVCNKFFPTAQCEDHIAKKHVGYHPLKYSKFLQGKTLRDWRKKYGKR